MQHYKRISFCLIAIVIIASGCAATRETPSRTGSAKADQIIQTAKSLIGTPYAWGGTTPKSGFDCSGYVCYVFGQNGYTLPRSTVEQTQVGQPISRKGLAPGDIVIFRLPGGGQRGLHTGIYLGNGTFIHSPRRGQSVKEENLNSPHWTKWYVGARRILPDFMAQMDDWDNNPKDLTVGKSRSKNKQQTAGRANSGRGKTTQNTRGVKNNAS